MGKTVKTSPPPDQHRHAMDYVAGANSLVSAVALFPEFFAVMHGKSTSGLSALSFGLIALNSIVWLLYGIHRRTSPLVVSSMCNAFASVGILIAIFSFN